MFGRTPQAPHMTPLKQALGLRCVGVPACSWHVVFHKLKLVIQRMCQNAFHPCSPFLYSLPDQKHAGETRGEDLNCFHVSLYSRRVGSVTYDSVKWSPSTVRRNKEQQRHDMLEGQTSIAKVKFVSAEIIWLGSFDLFLNTDWHWVKFSWEKFITVC